MVSLTRLALAHWDLEVLPGRVGDAIGARGVRVGENTRGVEVRVGAAGMDEPALCVAFCAATVSATAVSILLTTCVGSGVLSAPQAVISRDVAMIEDKSMYFIDLNIFSFHSVESIIL
jgi:hypothetical protein